MASPADAAKPETIDAASNELKLAALYNQILPQLAKEVQQVNWSLVNDSHKWNPK